MPEEASASEAKQPYAKLPKTVYETEALVAD